MKQRDSLFAMLAALCLVGFVCGSAGSNAQVPETQSNETKSVDVTADESPSALSMGAQPAEASTNRFVSEPFNLGRADWSGQVGQFLRAEGKNLQTLKLPDGTVFLGEVARGVPDGHGVFTQANGTNQEGEWRHGDAYRISGTWVGSDGTKEVGTWNYDGTPCGGTIFWKDGRVYKGDWELREGEPESPDGKGTMTWPDGRTYTGHFLDGKMDGAGKMTYPDGKVEDGTWMQGKFMDAVPTPRRPMPNDFRIIE